MEKTLLCIDNLIKTYGSADNKVEAVCGISFSISEGEVFGVVGESGSGKSTLLRLIAGMESVSFGQISFDGMDIGNLHSAGRRNLYTRMQMVFQSPVTSFDPRMTIRSSIYEPLRTLCGIRGEKALNERACELFVMVGLDPKLLDRYAYEISGGQCQRAAIARAIAVKPKLLLCDEITSALDVSAQANVVALICALSKSLGMSVLFVSHDIALVSNICTRSIVMHKGLCEECGLTRKLINEPQSEYTKKLVASASFSM